MLKKKKGKSGKEAIHVCVFYDIFVKPVTFLFLFFVHCHYFLLFMYMKESEKILNSSYDWIVGFTDWMGCSLALLYSTHLIRPKPFGHSTATWLHWRRMDHTPAQRQGPRSENRKTNSNVDEWFAQNVRNFTVQHSYKLCEMLSHHDTFNGKSCDIP